MRTSLNARGRRAAFVSAVAVIASVIVAAAVPIGPGEAWLDVPEPGFHVDSDLRTDQVDVVYNPERTEYLAVFQDWTSGDVYSIRYDHDGTKLADPVLLATHAHQAGVDWLPSVAYNPARNEYVTVMTAYTATPQKRVFALRMNANGQPIGGFVDVSGAHGNTGFCISLFGSVEYDPSTSGYVLAQTRWYATSTAGAECDGLQPLQSKVTVRTLSGTLAVGAEHTVGVTSQGKVAPVLARNPKTGHFMVANTLGADEKVQAVVFDSTFATRGTATLTTAGLGSGVDYAAPAADPVTGNWLVAMRTRFLYTAVVAVLSPTAKVLVAPHILPEGGKPVQADAVGDGTWLISGSGGVTQVAADGSMVNAIEPATGVLQARSAGDGTAIAVGAKTWATALGAVAIDILDPGLAPIVPARLADTRPGQKTYDGKFAGTGRVGAGKIFELTVAGRAGIPADASAAVLNVTAVTPSGPGYLTVFPCGQKTPASSSVNYFAGQIAPNAVLTKIGTGGKVCIYTLAQTDLIVDANGFAPSSSGLTTITPARYADTRPGEKTLDGTSAGTGRLGAGRILEVTIAGRGSIPAGAETAVLNVTAVNPGGPGYLTVFPCGQKTPTSSNVNYAAGQVVPNAVLTGVGTGGKVCIFTLADTDVIVDAAGYAAPGSSLITTAPARFGDTRSGAETVDGSYVGGGPIRAGSVYRVDIGGRGDVPADASVASLNVTAVGPAGPGYLTVYPCDATTVPTASNVNYTGGDVVPNAVISQLAGDGTVCVYTSSATDIIVDVNGFSY